MTLAEALLQQAAHLRFVLFGHRLSAPSSRFLPGGLSLDGCMVDPSEARHMGQMHYFCLLDEKLVPKEPENTLSLSASIHRASERSSSRKPAVPKVAT